MGLRPPSAGSGSGTDAGLWTPNTAVTAGSIAALPDGTKRVRAPGTPSSTRAQWDGTEASYWKLAPLGLAPFEYTPMTVFGHSWGNGGPDIASGARMADRLSGRLRANPLTNLAVSGKRMDEILTGQVQTSWTPNTLGWALFVDGTINDSVQYGDTTGIPTTQEAFRTCLSILSSKALLVPADVGIQFGGGGSAVSIPTNGYADVAFTGDAIDLQFGFVTGAGATFTIFSAAGTSLATVTTGGYKQAFTGTKRISGLGAGNHTVRVAATTGSGQLKGAAIPSANPISIVWVHSADRNTGSPSIALADQYADAAQTIAESFSNVIVVVADAHWDQTRYVGPGFHPNDLGHAYLANLSERAMAAVVHRQGLNQISRSTQDAAYTSPSPPAYRTAGATAPATPVVSAVTGFQVDLSWAAVQDNGATLTGYKIQSSPAGANTWTDVTTAGPTVTSYSVTGLTQGSSYDFRVAAINPVGTGSYSTTATATAGAPLAALFASDTFTDADGAGLASGHTADLGGPWVIHPAFSSGAAVIASNRLRNNAGAGLVTVYYMTGTPPSADYDVQADFVVQSLPAGAQTHICGRMSTSLATFYSARYRPDVSAWEIAKRVAGTSTVLATSATSVLNIGQSYTVKLQMRGTTIKMFVDGVELASVTDSSITAAGKAGVFLSETGAVGPATAIHVDNFIAR